MAPITRRNAGTTAGQGPFNSRSTSTSQPSQGSKTLKRSAGISKKKISVKNSNNRNNKTRPTLKPDDDGGLEDFKPTLSNDDHVLEKIHSLQPTTLNILDEAEKFLIARAPNLAPLIHKHRCDIFTVASLSQPIDPFQSLISGVIAQQVSGAAASTIKAKFINLFESQLSPTNMTFPTPSMVIAADQATLRTAGLSQRKAEYVCSVAEAFENGDLSAEFLANAGDKEIMDCLVKIRGIGVWSAEMFLIFALRRMDVFSTGDLGIQRGMAAWMGRDVAKLKSGKGKWKFMKEEEMKEISEKFRPYRTLFCWYMWRFEATDVQAMNNAN